MVEITKDTPVEEIIKLSPDCRCNACENGCKFGSGFLAKGDERRLAQLMNITEEELRKEYLEEIEVFNSKMLRPKLLRSKNKPYGRCIFFNEEKGCTVHRAKPLQCRASMGCKDYGEQLTMWFNLNHAVNADDPESIRQWAVYLKLHKPIKGGELKDLVPDTERLNKILSYEILK